MSRHINEIRHLSKEHELYKQSIHTNKMLITQKNGCLYSIFLEDDRIVDVAKDMKDVYPIGTILIGKVTNVLKESQGAFIRLDAKNTMAFLPLTPKELSHIRIQNRDNNGKIQQNDTVLIQIKKHPNKTKPYYVSGIIELSGKYIVIKDGTGLLHYSKKIPASELDRYQGLSFDSNDAMDIQIRTNAHNVSLEQIQKEYQNLYEDYLRILNHIKTRTLYSIVKPTDLFYFDLLKDRSKNYEVITDVKSVYDSFAEREINCRFYQDEQISLSKVYALDTKFRELLSKKVYLKSGAYLIIEPTEALISIDVNSGKAQHKSTPEEFDLQINIEAAREVAYQIRVRNLSGIILVDFINLKRKESRRKLIDVLCDELKKDSKYTTFVDFTKLGLAEITRLKTNMTLETVLKDWYMKE